MSDKGKKFREYLDSCISNPNDDWKELSYKKIIGCHEIWVAVPNGGGLLICITDVDMNGDRAPLHKDWQQSVKTSNLEDVIYIRDCLNDLLSEFTNNWKMK